MPGYGLCVVCRREAKGGVGRKARRIYRMYCGAMCREGDERKMIDPTKNEIAAMEHGGRMGGEVLDEIGKTDFATLTGEEWKTFIEAVCTGYVEHLQKSADVVRFDR